MCLTYHLPSLQNICEIAIHNLKNNDFACRVARRPKKRGNEDFFGGGEAMRSDAKVLGFLPRGLWLFLNLFQKRFKVFLISRGMYSSAHLQRSGDCVGRTRIRLRTQTDFPDITDVHPMRVKIVFAMSPGSLRHIQVSMSPVIWSVVATKFARLQFACYGIL